MWLANKQSSVNIVFPFFFFLYITPANLVSQLWPQRERELAGWLHPGMSTASRLLFVDYMLLFYVHLIIINN